MVRNELSSDTFLADLLVAQSSSLAPGRQRSGPPLIGRAGALAGA